MLALIAAIIFALAAVGLSFGEIDIVALGLAFLAAHFVFTIAVPFGRKGRR